MSAPAPKADGLSVLHVTMAEGGGVPQAMLDHVRSAPGARHHILWPAANAQLLDEAAPSPAVVHGVAAGGYRWWVEYRRQLRAITPDVVVAHSSLAGGLARLVSGGVPVVYQPHAYVLEDHGRPYLARRLFWALEKALARRSLAVIVLSEREAAIARSLGSDQIVFVPNTSHAERVDNYRHDGPVVACGRLCRQKDPSWFAELASRSRREAPGRSWVWLGDGDPELRARLEAAGVRVTGWLSQQQVLEQLASAAVYVHTAAYEGFPLAVLDAATVGLPLMVREIPAFQDYAGPRSDSIDNMLAGVLRVLRDREFANEMREFSRGYATRYSPESQESALLALYNLIRASLQRSSDSPLGSSDGEPAGFRSVEAAAWGRGPVVR